MRLCRRICSEFSLAATTFEAYKTRYYILGRDCKCRSQKNTANSVDMSWFLPSTIIRLKENENLQIDIYAIKTV